MDKLNIQALADKMKLPNAQIIGKPKIKFGDFVFDKETVEKNPILLFTLILCVDPTPKQLEIMKQIGIVFRDDNDKQFFPRQELEDIKKIDIDSIVGNPKLVKKIQEIINNSKVGPEKVFASTEIPATAKKEYKYKGPKDFSEVPKPIVIKCQTCKQPLSKINGKFYCDRCNSII